MRTQSGALIAIFAASIAGLFGCYRAHGRAGPDAPADASVLAPSDSGHARRDGGAAPGRDAGPPMRADAGPPLPPEPDPDLGPGARPSDYPEADEWLEPPALGEEDPCCELDDAIRIVSREQDGIVLAYERPSIAWGPGRWGLLAIRTFSELTRVEDEATAVLLELSADGRRIGEPMELEPRSRGGVIRWAEGRWAIGLETERDAHRDIVARLYDRDLRAAGDWHTLANADRSFVRFDLARLSHGDLWLGAILHGGTLGIRPFRESGPEAQVVPTMPSASDVRAVGLRSRVAVLLSQEAGGERANSVHVLGGGPEHAELGRVVLASAYGMDASAITSLRDLAFVVGIEAGHAQVEVIDPFAMTLVSGPLRIGVAVPSGEAIRLSVDASGSSKLGLVGACWGVSDGPLRSEGPARVDFRMIGPEGLPRGGVLRIADATFRGAQPNCAVGSDETGFLIAWRDMDGLWVRRVRVAD